MKTTPTRREVMAILNVTPDSFFAESRAEERDALRLRVESLLANGADIIDIGGCSTRPGAEDVPIEVEMSRVRAGVEAAREVAPMVTLSIDTFHSDVAEMVLRRWENVIVNDITGGERDPRIVEVAAYHRAPMVIMHSRGNPRTMQSLTEYGDVVTEVAEWLERRADHLRVKGVEEVILDPGIGFAKSDEQNFALLRGLERIASLGHKVLVGISRKSFICRTLGITPEEALEATTALHWSLLERGADILRVHDPLAAKQVITLFEKLQQP